MQLVTQAGSGSPLQALAAEVALLDDPHLVLGVAVPLVGRGGVLAEVVARLVLEVPGAVGAGHDAGAAADADVRVDEHDAVFVALLAGSRGADLDARCLPAVHAEEREREPLHVRIGPDSRLITRA